MMKKILCIILMAVMALAASAEQEEKKFDPQQFRRDQEAFITKEAKLTPQEAAAFFPLFRELQGKQRALFAQQRKLERERPCSDKEAAKQIAEMDDVEMQMAKLRNLYHNKFCRAIPAMKVKQCLRAEERFKHKVMDRLVYGRGGNKNRPHPNKGK
ncbi:MAG: hypothetical protein PUH57_00990 [Prevotellaceae bacterium]|nr:hypothetical protein [Prevotella sp.]MDD7246710.1 hypothetical protein [Prevotellaceae bacterium]MDY2749689.1 hypothetical protein [Prevotella sp.]